MAAQDTRCIYCRENKPGQMTVEHIWPSAFGGDLLPAQFQAAACAQCNNNLGHFVDGAFLHDFLANNELRAPFYKFISPPKIPEIPLHFLGVPSEAYFSDRTVELWAGPRGENIRYIHKNDRDEFTHTARGDVRRRRKDTGRLYVGFTRPHLYWVMTCLHSLTTWFPGARIYSQTRLEFQGNGPALQKLFTHLNNGDDLPKDELELSAGMMRKKRQIDAHARCDLGVYSRFACKFAIGLGSAFFGDAFLDTPEYETLIQSARSSITPIENRPHNLARFVPHGGRSDGLPHSECGICIYLFVISRTLRCVVKFPRGSEVLVSLPVRHPLIQVSSEVLCWFIAQPIKRCESFSFDEIALGNFQYKPKVILDIEKISTNIIDVDALVDRLEEAA